MIKFTERKRVGNLIEFHLTNNDAVLMTEKEFQSMNADELEHDYVFDGIEQTYHAVYTEKEFTDDPIELLGFEVVK